MVDELRGAVSGLLIDGRLVPVPGLRILPPASHGGPPWCRLHAGDYRARSARWVRQIILHTTKGLWPQPILPGAGEAGRARIVADFWAGSRLQSAAHLVVDTDGTVACMGDLARDEAYHAEASNPWSIGIEMYQLGLGEVYAATIDATATLVEALCKHFGIPEQMPRGPYRGVPLARMEVMDGERRRQLGGADIVGVLGHRDNTSARGRGDPGDAIFTLLEMRGYEALDYAAGEDLSRGRERQTALVARGEHITVDGLVGPASIQAARRQGFARWRDIA